MSLRKLSITMFSLIGLLLGSKIGLHIWQMSATTTTSIASISSPSSLTSIDTQSDMIIPEPSQQASANQSNANQTSPNQSSPKPAMSAAQSLAALEAFLIPSANAEIAAGAASRPGSGMEDETLSTLRQLKDGLDQRSKTLDQREQTVRQAEDQLKQRITELEQLEASIQQRLLDESKVKSKKIKRLTAVYEGMKPNRSAPVIARMELATVVKIFLLMDEKKVGKILSFLPPEKAVIISQALTKRISSIK
ncbi:MAG: hypothetical protein Q9M16_09195 [Mariprofundus sp.]|nr:hypothetical protein [Mariprofundus sp.]